MPRFQIDIEKLKSGEYWTNVYHCNAPTMELAIATMNNLVEMERSFHKTYVLFTKARVANAPGIGHLFSIQPINENGLVPSTGDSWPLFNCVRVLLDSAGYTRDGFKYYRLPLEETDVAGNGVISESTRLVLEIGWAAALIAINESGVDMLIENGQEFTSVSVDPNVRMRQLKRGSKKPVIPSP